MLVFRLNAQKLLIKIVYHIYKIMSTTAAQPD